MRWRFQPLQPVGVDWSHPLARGLGILFNAAGPAGRPVNLVDGSLAVQGTAGAPVTSVVGGYISRDYTVNVSAGEYWTKLYGVHGPMTLSAIVNDADTNSNIISVAGFEATSSLGTGDFALRYNGTNLRGVYYNTAQVNAIGSTRATWKNIPVLVTLVWDGANLRLYENGKQTASTATAQAASASAKDFALSTNSSGGTGAPGFRIPFAAYWTRALSAAEVQQLYSDTPWQLFRQRAPRSSVKKPGAAITTAAAGNWSSTATWTGGVVPGDGDTVTLNHNVTVDVPVTVGSSPATGGTAAIAWGTADVVLTINANLTLRGDIIPKDSFTLGDLVVQAAGVTVTFDSTAAASPSTTHYRCLLWNDNVDWRWKFNGTSASPCVLQSAAGGGVGYFDNNAHSGGPRINASWTKFLRIGDATNQGFSIFFGGASPEFTLANCVADTCGTFQAKNGPAASLLSVTNTVFKNGVGGNGDMQTGIIESATTPGVIDNCYFSGYIEGAWGSMKLTNNVFVGTFIADSDTASTTFQHNIVTIKAAVGCPGTVDHCYMIDLDNTDSNPQGLKPAAFNHDITFCLFESSYPTQAAGDFIINGNGSAFTYNIKNNILIPNANGTSPGKLCSLIAASSLSHFVVEHNTVVSNWSTGNESGVVQYGESGGGAVGEVTSLKSNLAWSSVAGNNAVQIGRLQGTQQDEVSAANTGYNATWNGANGGTDPVGYISATAGSIFSAAGAGAHDIVLSANPFVDSTRNFSKWGASIGGAGTNADTLDLLRKRLDWTDAGYNASNGATVAALVAWVQAGFYVTAASLQNAGADGVTIGAMPFSGGSTYSVSVTEAGSATDSLTAAKVLVATVTEAGSAADAATALANFTSSLSESGSAADALTPTAAFVASVSESGSAADSLTAAKTLYASISEAGNATDTLSAIATFVASLAEAGAATDTLSNGNIFNVSITESGSAGDALSAVAAYTASLHESGSAADVYAVTASFVAAVTEAGAASDALSAVATFLAACSEAGAALDTVAATLTAIAAIVESGAASDTLTVFAGVPTEAAATLLQVLQGKDTLTVVQAQDSLEVVQQQDTLSTFQ